jgi:hypothetical protein
MDLPAELPRCLRIDNGELSFGRMVGASQK